MKDVNSGKTIELLKRLTGGDSQEVVAAARELASRQEGSAAPQLLEVLRTTHDATVRNAVALALSDLKYPQAFDVLVDLLNQERTRGHRGTLLYALGAFDCSSILSLLVDFVIEGSFEVSREALSLLAGIETELDEGTWTACTERVQSALVVASQERHPLLVELMGFFEQDDE